MKEIEYKVDFCGVCLTNCPYTLSCKVGSNACFTCEYFGGSVMYEKKQDEAGRGIIKCNKL